MRYNRIDMEKEGESLIPSETAKHDNNQEAGAEPEVEAAAAPPDLAEELAKLRAEKDALYDRLLRKQAELDNFRKRTQREKEDFLQHAKADLIRALLPTLDGFDRALKQRDSNVPERYYQGLELIYRELWDVLTRAGLTPLETVGKTFDPHLHEAVESIEASEHRDQEIVEELQRGYKLKQRLLRPAAVKVAVAPSRAGGKASPEADEN